MPLDSKTVGTNERQVIVIGDQLTASNYSGVMAFADAQNLSTQFGALFQNVALLLNASGNYNRQKEAVGATGIPAINTEGSKTTYSFAILGFTPAATATDFWKLVGSASKTIRLLRLAISGIATAAATNEIQLIKRTTDDTGGTSASITIGTHDSNDAAPSATAFSYSVNPTGLGTSAGVYRAQKLNLGAAGSAGQVIWDFTTRNSKGLVLRGVAQIAALNWNGAAVPAGTSLCIECEYSEE